MKPKITLLPILIIALLCTNLFGSNTSGARQAQVAGLPNPALVGIEAIRVVVMYHNAVIGRDDWIFRELGAMAEQRLAASDPRIAYLIERGYAARYQNIPVLTINIDKLILNPARPPVFYVRTSFTAGIAFARNPSSFFRTELWARTETIQAQSLQDEFTAVTTLVNKHIELFASDFKQANAAILPAIDVNDFNNILSPANTGSNPKRNTENTCRKRKSRAKIHSLKKQLRLPQA